MTDVDIIKNAVDVLGSIAIPVNLLESVGAPIYQVRKNLNILLNAIIEKTKQEQENIEQKEVTEQETE
jgi:hypothetical protein